MEPPSLSAPSAPATPSTLLTQIPNFSAKYNLLAIVPVVVLTTGSFITATPLGITGTTSLRILSYGGYVVAATAPIGYLLYRQINYLRQYYAHKNIKPQLILLILSFLLPIIAINFGDIQGAAQFNTPANGLLTSGLTGAAVGLATSTVFAIIMAVGNMIYIKTKGLSSALRIIGIIVYVIGFLIVAFIAFVAYSLTYSAHDPSSE